MFLFTIPGAIVRREKGAIDGVGACCLLAKCIQLFKPSLSTNYFHSNFKEMAVEEEEWSRKCLMKEEDKEEEEGEKEEGGSISSAA